METNSADKCISVSVIIGSPRKGNTYKFCSEFTEKVSEINPCIRFDFIHLKDYKIEMCRGCHACLLKGVEKCPVKDDVQLIFQKLKSADSFILASPGYNQHVPGIMKNFIDRMSFNCHEPALIGKNAVTVTTVGGMGAEAVSKYLTTIATCWGAHVSQKLVELIDYKNNLESYRRKIVKVVEKTANSYNQDLVSEEKPKPNLYDLMIFASLREETRFSEHFRNIWIEKGWADSDYYYDEGINIFNRIIAKILGFIVRKEMTAVFKKSK